MTIEISPTPISAPMNPNSGSLVSPIQAMKKILGLRYLASIFGTLRRIRLERPDESGSGSGSGANQILFELSMTEDLLGHVAFCNSKVKSFQYALLIEDPETEESARVVTA